MPSSNNAWAVQGNSATKSNNVAAAQIIVPALPIVPLSLQAPATLVLASGQTTGSITIPNATGGSPPYTYIVAVSFDSTGIYAPYISSVVGNVINLINLSNGQFIVLDITVKDSTGAIITVQGTVTILTAGATIIAGTSPASQTLAAGTLTATIGTWGSPSGGTGPYTYTLTEPTGNGSVITGSGLGPYTTTGLTNGRSYAYLLTITDSLGAKGYSVVTINIAYAIPEWEVITDTVFTDANWTSLNSTDSTLSTVNPQHILYAANGVTPRAQVWNNVSQARRLQIDPSSTGLALITTSTAASPSIKIIPLNADGKNPLQLLDWTRDLIKVEFLVEGEEPAGSSAFVHLAGFASTTGNGANQHGYRNLNSGSSVYFQRRSWTTSDDLANQGAIATSPTRKYQVSWEGYMTGSRTIESYGSEGSTLSGLPVIPRSGKYYMHQAVSQTMSQTPTLTTFNNNTIGGWGIMIYCDGTTVDTGLPGGLSRVTLKRIRISRLPGGSKP